MKIYPMLLLLKKVLKDIWFNLLSYLTSLEVHREENKKTIGITILYDIDNRVGMVFVSKHPDSSTFLVSRSKDIAICFASDGDIAEGTHSEFMKVFEKHCSPGLRSGSIKPLALIMPPNVDGTEANEEWFKNILHT